jgi:hypothetical protein
VKNLKRAAALTMLAGGLAATGAGIANADSGAEAAASHSPGVLSGNNVEVPIDLDANVCGDSINVIGLLNPASGSACYNG